MSNAGKILKRWKQIEIDKLHQLYNAGKSRKEIAEALGMEPDRIRQRLQWESQSEARLNLRTRKKRTFDPYLHSPNPYRDCVGTVTSLPETLADRDLRYRLEPRDLTAQLCGDPLPGYSALEKRA